MNTDSFTDEQLLNLVNNTITQKTEFTPNDFTGGAVIITSTHNNTIKKYRVSLYFGYKGKHSINRQIDISKELYFIWAKAILVKILSLDVENVGMDVNELNKLMKKSNSSIVDSSIVFSKKYGDTPVPTTVPQPKKQKIDTLIDLIEEKLSEKKLLTYKSKLNKTKSKAVIDTLPSPDMQDISDKYCSYIGRNKNMASRLDIWLIAYSEGSTSNIEYADSKESEPKRRRFR